MDNIDENLDPKSTEKDFIDKRTEGPALIHRN
jgi:hypothetical protein